MYEAQHYDGLPALLWNSLLAANERTGTVDGVVVTMTSSTTAITADVSAGTVSHDGTSTGVTAQQVTFDPNPSQYPRRDVVWVDTTGTAQVRKGEPEPYEPTRDTDEDYVFDRPARKTVRPAPDDMGDVLRSNPPTGVVSATVDILPNANDATDISNEEVTDMRVTVAASSGSGSHDTLTDVSVADHRSDQNIITTVDGANISILGNAASADTAAEWAGYDLYVQNTVPTTNEPYIRFEDA